MPTCHKWDVGYTRPVQSGLLLQSPSPYSWRIYMYEDAIEALRNHEEHVRHRVQLRGRVRTLSFSFFLREERKAISLPPPESFLAPPSSGGSPLSMTPVVDDEGGSPDPHVWIILGINNLGLWIVHRLGFGYGADGAE